MPASGWKDFDEQKDALRRTINAWIRSEAKADGIIDFDEALRDPASPSQLQQGLQADWLHPNDAGYQKMAQTAAEKLRAPQTTTP
jgi:lysophospholipase L1-like esterase